MKSQKHNLGELKQLSVNIEADLVDAFHRMSKNTNIKIEDLVAIALKRFRSSHNDYDCGTPKTE